MYEFRVHPLTRWAAACLCLLLSTSGLHAQDRPAVPAGSLTLEQVLQLAESRSETIAVSQAAVRRAEGEQVRARSGLYPQLSASASYDRALASEFEGVFDDVSLGGDGSGGDASGGDGTDGGGFEDLPFGRKNTWRATLNFTQNLYSGGRNGAQMTLASAGRDSAQLGVTTTRAQLLFDVTQAYYDAVLSEQLVTIAQSTLEQAGATLQQTQAGFDAGTQPEFEVLRARVSRDNQAPVVIRQRVNRELAMLRLKQMLELPAEADLQLADRLTDERLAPPPPFAERVSGIEAGLRVVTGPLAVQSSTPLPQRTAVAEVGAAVRVSEAALRLAETQRLPSVTLNTSYGRIGYPSGVVPEFDRANWTVGATLQVPILTGGRQRGDEAVARAELEQTRAQLKQTEELAALDTRSAWSELVAARAAWEATAGTVQEANRAYEIADVRFRAGVSTQLELSDSRLLLQQAEANRAQAARDLQVARARVALLPDLPLGNSTAGTAPRVPAVTSPQPRPAGAGQLRNASAQGAQTQAGTR
jgi:outer membrane protein